MDHLLHIPDLFINVYFLYLFHMGYFPRGGYNVTCSVQKDSKGQII